MLIRKRLIKYIEAGQTPEGNDYSFPAFGNLNRTVEAVDEAASRLNLDNDKMLAALFWFWKGNEITDEPALEALKDGDESTAIDIWRGLTNKIEDGSEVWSDISKKQDVTKKNASAFHNLAVLYFLLQYDIDSETIEFELRFLESNFWQKLKDDVTDATYKTDKKALQMRFLTALAEDDEVELSELIKCIADIDFAAKQDFLKSVSQKFTANINTQIETARKARTANKQQATAAGETLYKNTNSSKQKFVFFQ
ncbi:MAG: hypothetical protein LBR64_06725 [Dysgonamonadaceae bacterium]|nr:hypothetical protein [Dysgonamonadaceae bacterium]